MKSAEQNERVADHTFVSSMGLGDWVADFSQKGESHGVCAPAQTSSHVGT